MGLDIYFYKTNEKLNSINDTHKLIEQKQKETLGKLVNDMLNGTITEDKFLIELKPFIKYNFIFDDIKGWLELDNLTEKSNLFHDFVDSFYIRENMYFRKFNFIYKFFENALDENEQCWVDRCELEDIVQSCKDILAVYDKTADDNTKACKLAKELLPTTNGFFFGNTDYNEFYFQQLEYALDTIEHFLGNLKKDEYVFVQMSW